MNVKNLEKILKLLKLLEEEPIIDREVCRKLSLAEFDDVYDYLFENFKDRSLIQGTVDIFEDDRMYFIYKKQQFILRFLRGIGYAYQFVKPIDGWPPDWEMKFNNDKAINLDSEVLDD